MAFVRTTKLIALFEERLKSLKIEGSAEPLFQRVGVFGANQLVAAMRATFASENRVCFIVPGGDTHANSQPDVLMVHSKRNTRIALLIADKAFDQKSTAALIGGPDNVGILELKDQLIENLTTVPMTLADVAFVPSEGEPMLIEPEHKNAGTAGRECWLQWFTTYAGSEVISIPQ
jgi:hypothetical protein